jgi:phage replication O-like protein O
MVSSLEPCGSMRLPNVITDRLLPRLRDTELRLLLIILRQTWGWRKERDWLSHQQLKAKTGRGSAAISRAIAALIRLDLIVVRGVSGQILASAAERQREPSGLYFSVHPSLTLRLLAEQRVHDQKTNSKSENNNKQTDKERVVAAAVVVDPNDHESGATSGFQTQKEHRDDHKQSTDARKDRGDSGGKMSFQAQPNNAADGQSSSASPQFFSDPMLEATWRKFGQQLRRNKREDRGSDR